MQAIYKYPIALIGPHVINMPHGAEVLTAQTQGRDDEFCLWAKIIPNNNTERIEVNIIGTGEPLDHKIGTYLSTIQLYDGALVYHVFIHYLDR